MKKAIKKYWKKDPLGVLKMIIEVVVVFGLITYLTFAQTKIAQRQLEIEEQQQQIQMHQTAIFNFEHNPRYQIVEYFGVKDSVGDCITESIQIQNEGYPINTKEIQIYSFFEIGDTMGVTTIFPVKFYYRIGADSGSGVGVLEAHTGTHNCKKYFQLQAEMLNHVDSYYWFLDRFHVVKIEWEDILGESHISYFSTRTHQPYQGLDSKKALKLILLHKQNFKINMQEPINIETIINKVKETSYNKVYLK